MDSNETHAQWDEPDPCPSEKIQVGLTTWLILFFRPGGHLDVALTTRTPGGGARIDQLGA